MKIGKMLKGHITTIYLQHGQKQGFVKSLVSKTTQNEREMIEANNKKLHESEAQNYWDYIWMHSV